MPHKPAPLLEGQQTKTLTLRLPVEMYTQLVDLATKERRNIHNQLLVLLERVLVPHEEELDGNA